tara:strand:+ start:1535 stop:2737 length:1203 start_codon:yes stop_codon:yes gene_type:complete
MPQINSQNLKRLAVYLSIWTLVLASFAAQYRWGIELPWPRAIVRVIVDWSPWIALAPIVWWLANRFPIIEKQRRIRNVLFHVFASIALITLAESLVVFAIAPAARAVIPQGAEQRENILRGGKGPGANRPAQRRRAPQAQSDEINRLTFQIFSVARKSQFWFPLYWVLVFFASSARHFREAQSREKKSLQLQRDLARAQLTAIQSRLEPHFLFNTLNSISCLVHSDPDKADEMIAQLSELLRSVHARSETQEIVLREELELLQSYLSIQKIRFPKRLQVRETIEDETLDCLVPTLLLQPLAENAVRHGIEPKAEPSTLLISSRLLDNSRIELVVEDDGIGWENTPTQSDSREGFGLSNIKSRLEALHTGESVVTISTPPGGGTRIVICFPAKSRIETAIE